MYILKKTTARIYFSLFEVTFPCGFEQHVVFLSQNFKQGEIKKGNEKFNTEIHICKCTQRSPFDSGLSFERLRVHERSEEDLWVM